MMITVDNNLLYTVFLACLVLTLDWKLWSKIDRVTNLMIGERLEIYKQIRELLKKVEAVEKRLEQKEGNIS